ncbi:MAG: hypothetical protein AAB306_01615 [Pseudomonadota bacterium]
MTGSRNLPVLFIIDMLSDQGIAQDIIVTNYIDKTANNYMVTVNPENHLRFLAGQKISLFRSLQFLSLDVLSTRYKNTLEYGF